LVVGSCESKVKTLRRFTRLEGGGIIVAKKKTISGVGVNKGEY
jgi:hypothetical protein